MADTLDYKIEAGGIIAFFAISLFSLLGAFVFEAYSLVLIPVIIVFGYVAIIDFSKIFYLLLFFIPISIEYSVTDSLATDLPTEPVMVALMFIYIIYIIANPSRLNVRFLVHPLIVLLFVHYFWTFITALNAENILVSMKFFLAKTWYIIVFVFLAGLILKDIVSFKTAFWCVFIPLLAAAMVTLARQSITGFSFEDVNDHVVPYFRNHVNYGIMLTLFLPFVWLAASWYRHGSFKRRLLVFSRVIFLIAIYFSFTRACWMALIAAGIAYLLINRNLLKYAFVAALIAAGAFFYHLSKQNEYLKYAPVYERTLTYKDFEEHIAATARMEDASSMERFYRWIAAAYMVEDKPLLGYGPGNFYPNYMKYTVTEFETYISENEEQSTVHNYFLLVLVEQGIPGLVIFIVFSFAIFFYGEKIVRMIPVGEERSLAIAIVMSQVILFATLLLNDLIEADKTGTFFFMNIALLVNLELKYKKKGADSEINRHIN